MQITSTEVSRRAHTKCASYETSLPATGGPGNPGLFVVQAADGTQALLPGGGVNNQSHECWRHELEGVCDGDSNRPLWGGTGSTYSRATLVTSL